MFVLVFPCTLPLITGSSELKLTCKFPHVHFVLASCDWEQSFVLSLGLRLF